MKFVMTRNRRCELDNYLWLLEPIHQNKFRGFKLKDNPAVIDSLKLSFDGAIMAVLRGRVESHYKEQKVSLIRHGYEKMPDKLKIDDEESFFKYLAYFVNID